MTRNRMAASTLDAVLFAPVGGNSGLLAMLAWQLWVQRRIRAVEWHVVVLPRGADHMDADMLAPGGALDRLHDLDPALLPRERLNRVVFAPRPEADLETPSSASEAAYLECVLAASRKAVANAGGRPVVFALVAGRDRVMTVAATLTAQRVARAGDIVVDLRVSPPEAVRDGRYVLPSAAHRGAFVGAARVSVELVDVPIPHLSDPLPSDGQSISGGRPKRSGATGDDAKPVRLDLDLRDEQAPDFVHGFEIQLSPALKLLLAAFALASSAPDKSMRWPSRPMQPGHPMTEVMRRVPWSADVPTTALARFRGYSPNDGPRKFDPEQQRGKLTILTRGFTDLRRHAATKLAEFAAEHPELPPIGFASKKIGGPDPHTRTWLVGLVPKVTWPNASAVSNPL